jgi:hypothetical protein
MDFRTVSEIVIGIIVVIGLLLLGDYLGYKVTRKRLAMWGGFGILGIVVLYAIYAIVVSFIIKV